MILPSTDAPEAVTVAERLRAEVSRCPIELADGRLVAISASFGVARLCQQVPSAHFDDLVRDADLALYQAKQHGRDRVSHFAGQFSATEA